MKLDLLAERRRQMQEKGAAPGDDKSTNEDPASPKSALETFLETPSKLEKQPGKPEKHEKAPQKAADGDHPKSWSDRLSHLKEVLTQPIGADAKEKEKEKGKGKGKGSDKEQKGKQGHKSHKPGEGHKGASSGDKPKSWAEDMGMKVPAKPSDPKARQAADDHIAQGTYHLKRGNREPNVEKKIECFEQALVHFKALKELVPNDVTVGKQVEMVERGLTELRGAFERYRASNPEGSTQG